MPAITITKPVVGGSQGTWGSILNQALDDLVTQINTNTTDLTTAKTDITTAKTDITSLKSRVTTAENNISTLQSGSSGGGSANGFYSVSTRSGNSSYGNGAHLYETSTQRHWVGSSTAWVPMPGSIVFKARSGSSANLADSTWVDIPWTVEYDRMGVGVSGSAYTPGLPGWYELTGSSGFSLGGSSTNPGTRSLCWYISGSQANAGQSTFPGAGTVVVPARALCVLLTASDSIALKVYQNSGSTLTMLGSNAQQASHMCVKYLGPA